MAKLSKIEIERQERIKENERHLQDFGIVDAADALAASRAKPQAPRRRSSLGAHGSDGIMEIRRSGRVQNMPAVSYKDLEERNDHLRLTRGPGRRSAGPYRPRSGTSTCSEEARDEAEARANAIKVEGPAFVKRLLQSMISGGFWLQWPNDWCVVHMPSHDVWVTLLDADGEAWECKYLGGKKGLSAGWRGYSIHKGFDDGDALAFEVLDKEKWRVKVHIVRADRDGTAALEGEEGEVDEVEIDDEEEEVIPVSADSDQGGAALVKEPSIDSPPKKRKREPKVSTSETVKAQPAAKKRKLKHPSKKAQDDGLKQCAVDFVRGRRVSPEGVVSFLLKVKGVQKPVWVVDERVSGDSVHCWLSGEEEEEDT